ncbi:MAG: InlB B-repeat-containing protein [Fibrobacter sp.]|nr:InlB B-repeat-containing protein [Fibrobacter sp.]
MNTGKISLGKLLSLLIFVAGVQSALADVWDGTTRTKANETTIDGKKYYLIESAANLAWFSDSVNIYVSKEQAKRFSADSLAPATMTSSDTAKAEAYAGKVKKNFLDTASTDDLKKDSTKIWNKAKNDSLKVVADSIKEAKAEIIAANVDAFFKSFGNNYDAITAIAEKTEKKSYEVIIEMNAKVVADYIDMNHKPFVPIAAGKGDALFKGVFDGNHVTIKNLSVSTEYISQINKNFGQNVAFIAALHGGMVKDVVLDSVSIKAETDIQSIIDNASKKISVGTIVAWQKTGTVQGCYASGILYNSGKGQAVGGVVGNADEGLIKDNLSVVSIQISGSEAYVGGVIGQAKNKVKIESCVYDGGKFVNDLTAHDGGVIGLRYDDNKTLVSNTYYDENDVDKGVAVGPAIGIYAVSFLNDSQIACILNEGDWDGASCSKEGVWSTGDHITNQGVSKDSNGATIYTITFSANGGSYPENAKKTVKYLRFGDAITGDEISIPKNGFKKFEGWALSPTATKKDDNLGFVYAPTTVYAVWTDVTTYTIIFDFNTGSNATQLTKVVAKGDSITLDGFTASQLPSTYKANGRTHNFAGWAKTTSGAVLDNFGIATKNNETFYAQWTLSPVYKVTYMTGHESVYREEIVEEGDYAKGPAENPSKEGYKFEGWYTEENCQNLYDLNGKAILTQNLVLYAKWTPARYKIAYNLSDGWTNSVENPGSYTVEDNVVFKAPTYKNDSLVFDGWFYDGASSNKAEQIAPGSRTGDLSLYYKSKVRTYTIWLIGGDDGLDIVEPVIKRYGDPVPLPGESYKKAGYVQDGWATTPGGDKAYDLSGTYTANAEIELYPHWKKAVYKITYELNGGINDAGNIASYTIDDADITLKNPTKDGFAFKGWYTTNDSTGTKVTKIDVKSSYHDTTLYALWNQVKVTVEVKDTTCVYNGKSCGAQVTWSKLPNGYKAVTVTDSIKNVLDGPIDAKLVSFAIINTKTNEVVTDKFNVVYVNTSATVAVSKKDVSFAGDDETKEYTGNEIHVVSKATPTGLVSGHTHNVGYEITATEAGTYPAEMTATADVKILDKEGHDVTANYNVTSITGPATGLTISPKVGTFTIAMANEYVTVGGSIQGMPTSNAVSGVTTFWYHIEGDGVDDWKSKSELTLPTTPGKYTINIKAENPNYTGKPTTTAEITVTAKPVITVIAKDAQKVYDGTALTMDDFTVTGLKEGDALTAVITGTIINAGSTSNKVGAVTVTRGGSSVAGEYEINKIAGTLTVTKAPLTITTASDSKTYDGTALTASGSISGLVGTETATVTPTGKQTVVGSSVNTYEKNKIVWGAAKSSNYYIKEVNLGTLTVTPAEVTIKVDAGKSKIYGDADPEFTGNVSGLFASDNLGVRYYRRNPSKKDAGSYEKEIVASYTPNPNYRVTADSADFTIDKRSVTLSTGDGSKVYDGTALVATDVAVGGDGFAPGEGAYFTVTGSQTNVGTSVNAFIYELKEGTDVDKNYTITKTEGTLKVTKASANVTIVGRSGTYAYNGVEQVVSGYDVLIDNPLYEVSDYAFSGDSVIKKIKSGAYTMGLSKELFTNKNNNFDVTFNVTDGSLAITPPEIVVAYNDAGDTLHVVVGDDDSDSLISEKINDALTGHVPPIPLPTKSDDKDSTYTFDGWGKNPATGSYEPVFDATVKKDTIDVKYQDNPEKYIDVEIHVTDVHKDIVEKINEALEQQGIALPSKPDDGDSTYTLDWKKNEKTGSYEPDFKGTLLVEMILVKYGDGATDTIHVVIRAKDSKSQIEQKINDALNNHLPPIKVKGKDDSYTLAGWEKDESTGYYVPVFTKGDVVYVINFHLPEGAELTKSFKGYNYGEVTVLPDAVMKSDTSWKFKGWYTKTKGRGERVKAMRETDAGNKSLYPLFQKTIRYDANGDKGEIVVIYTDRADTTIARALLSVKPKDYTKNGKTFTFDKWVLEDGVYKAEFKSASARFNVVVESRAFNIEKAQVGARYAVFDMDGRVVKRGIVSNGSQRVDVPKSGSYTVRVDKDAVQVNVK